MYILGSECTITLARQDERTAIPYNMETLREEPEETPLDPLVGYILPLAHIHTGGKRILGCLVTRICPASLTPLATVLTTGQNTPFALQVNRIAEKRLYRELILTGFEVRAELDEPVYIRLDIEGKEAAEWDYRTMDIPWEQRPTLEYLSGDITLDGSALTGIYRFSLTRLSGEANITVLQMHYALDRDHPLNNERSLDLVTLTFGGRLRLTATALNLLSFEAKTDNAEEILIYRRYRVDGTLLIEVCNDKGEWGVPS